MSSQVIYTSVSFVILYVYCDILSHVLSGTLVASEHHLSRSISDISGSKTPFVNFYRGH